MTATLYSKPGCPWCDKAKEWLKKHKVKFKEINCQEDQKAYEYIQNKSGESGVPQLEVNGKVIVGYDEEAYEETF